MIDPENESDVIEQGPDAGFAAFAERIAILANTRRYAALMKDLQKQLAALVEATATVAEQATERQAKAFAADHEREHKELRRRQIATLERKRSLEPRRDRLAKLHQSWRNLGEPPEVASGFKSPEFTPIQKARRAHGISARPPAASPAEELPPDHWADGEFAAGATISRQRTADA
jgi:hypothetical protein